MLNKKVERWITCDVLGCPEWTDIFSVFSAAELRKWAKQEGWKRVKGKDICPDCVQDDLEAKGQMRFDFEGV